MPSPVSIKDLATAAGVSHSTVSRAIRGAGRVSAATRARILTLAREMGYYPNEAARSLVMGRTKTIGVVVTTIGDPFVTQVVNGIEDAAHEAGYSVFLSSSRNQADREMAVVRVFRQRRVDAVIVTSSRVGSLYGDALAEFGVPIVLINSQHEGRYLYSIAVDDTQGAELAVEHLLQLGHRRIGYVGSETRPVSCTRRKAGYRQALARHGLALDPSLNVQPQAANDLSAGRLGLEMLLPANPSAIFAYNDVIAIGALLEARKQGIAIPDQVSLMGFDDIEATEFVTPTLTTVRQPKADMGRAAVEMVLALLKGDEVSNRWLPGELVVRESTTACPW